MLWVALPLLAGVNVERGRVDARAWSPSHGNDGPGDEVEVVAVVNGICNGENRLPRFP